MRRVFTWTMVASLPMLGILALLGRPAEITPYLCVSPIWAILGFRRVKEKDARFNYLIEPRYCGRCDYDLTGNVSGVCPECGWKLKTEVS